MFLVCLLPSYLLVYTFSMAKNIPSNTLYTHPDMPLLSSLLYKSFHLNKWVLLLPFSNFPWLKPKLMWLNALTTSIFWLLKDPCSYLSSKICITRIFVQHQFLYFSFGSCVNLFSSSNLFIMKMLIMKLCPFKIMVRFFIMKA